MWQYRWTRLFGNAIQGSCLSASAFSRGQATGARMPVSASVLRRVLLIVFVTGLSACGKTEPPPSPPPTPAVAANPKVDVELVEALRVFEGRFDWRSDLGEQGRYVFAEIESTLAAPIKAPLSALLPGTSITAAMMLQITNAKTITMRPRTNDFDMNITPMARRKQNTISSGKKVVTV